MRKKQAGAVSKTVSRVGVVLGALLCSIAIAEPSQSTLPENLTDRSTSDDISLYQLLYDYHFNEPLNELGQKVRILIWVRYLRLSAAQQQMLLNLAVKFQERLGQVEREETLITRNYEEKIEPVYLRIHQEIQKSAPDEETLKSLARELQGINLAYRREDELHTLRIRMVRTIMSEEENFLHTLSPEQEEKLVTSLFFLRRELDPFANPETYRRIIGPTWNAGDFSPLLRQQNPKESVLNIGGLWGIDEDGRNKVNYADIRRPVVLFFVLKDPGLIPAMEESLGRRKQELPPGQAPPP